MPSMHVLVCVCEPVVEKPTRIHTSNSRLLYRGDSNDLVIYIHLRLRKRTKWRYRCFICCCFGSLQNNLQTHSASIYAASNGVSCSRSKNNVNTVLFLLSLFYVVFFSQRYTQPERPSDWGSICVCSDHEMRTKPRWKSTVSINTTELYYVRALCVCRVTNENTGSFIVRYTHIHWQTPNRFDINWLEERKWPC